MTARLTALILLVAILLAAPSVQAQDKVSRFAQPANAQQAASLKREEDQALESAAAAVREMQTLAKTPIEKELANSDAKIMGEIRRLVLQRQAARASASASQMQDMQMSFNLQYLQLQSQMQNENRRYTAVSNIMKTDGV